VKTLYIVSAVFWTRESWEEDNAVEIVGARETPGEAAACAAAFHAGYGPGKGAKGPSLEEMTITRVEVGAAPGACLRIELCGATTEEDILRIISEELREEGL
jgi:hypothetical protein